MAELGIGDYVKAAFRVPYNVILLSGGILAGVISLHPQVVWPLVAAGEILYLATMSSLPRFQAVVRAKRGVREAAQADDAVPALLSRLNPVRVQRFEQVRRRCVDLQRSLAGEGQSATDGILESQQLEGVNKLLWVFLRTLIQEETLATFCATMPRKEIEDTLKRTESALSQPGLAEPMKAAHQENVQVLRLRLENLRRAEDNLEAVGVRLVRVENSIMLIQEQALTRRDPAFVESEVKSVTEGLQSVEEMMRSMNIPQTGAVAPDVAPDFLRMAGPAKTGQTL